MVVETKVVELAVVLPVVDFVELLVVTAFVVVLLLVAALTELVVVTTALVLALFEVHFVVELVTFGFCFSQYAPSNLRSFQLLVQPVIKEHRCVDP